MKEKDKPVLSNRMQQKAHEASRDSVRAPLTTKVVGRPNSDIYKMTFRIPRETARRMQEIAFSRNTTLQDIVAVACDHWLAAENEVPFYPEGWSEKKKAEKEKE